MKNKVLKTIAFLAAVYVVAFVTVDAVGQASRPYEQRSYCNIESFIEEEHGG